jgi:hypothetical protein
LQWDEALTVALAATGLFLLVLGNHFSPCIKAVLPEGFFIERTAEGQLDYHEMCKGILETEGFISPETHGARQEPHDPQAGKDTPAGTPRLADP